MKNSLKKPVYSALIAWSVAVCTAFVVKFSSCSVENTGTKRKSS